MEEESEQAAEIKKVLVDAEVISPKDEWDSWEADIQAQVDKLINDSRTLRIAVMAIGAISLSALGVAAVTSKTMAGIMQALGQLGDNQMAMANALGMVEKPTAPTPVPVVEEVKVEDVKSIDVDPNAVVGKPFDGPATEASAEAKAQMERDKAAGIIDLAREPEPN